MSEIQLALSEFGAGLAVGFYLALRVWPVPGLKAKVKKESRRFTLEK